MVGLLDIAPLVETVEIRGAKVDVTGIAAEDIPYLIGRFQILGELASKGEFNIEKLSSIAPDALAAVFACGCGMRGDAAAEKVLRTLKLGEQTDLFVAIIKTTLPGGVGPFGEKLTALGLFNSLPTKTESNPAKP